MKQASKWQRPGATALVLPVYNEVATVSCVLDAVRAVYGGPMWVVDDGSTDGTAEAIRSRSDVEIIRHEQNLGYGRSLIDGFGAAMLAGAEAIVTMDCDGQHEPGHIVQFCETLATCGTDIVSGSRYLPASGVAGEAPKDRQAVNRRVTDIVNAVTGWSLTDSFCGFKAYRADALLRAPIDEPGYAMPLEFWARAWHAGLTVCEMPVERIYNDHDRSFGQDLDDAERRFAYYMSVWERALAEGAAPATSQEG